MIKSSIIELNQPRLSGLNADLAPVPAGFLSQCEHLRGCNNVKSNKKT